MPSTTVKFKTGFATHPSCILHQQGPTHPERPERLENILSLLRQNPLWNQLDHLSGKAAPIEMISRVHDPKYVENLYKWCVDLRPEQILNIDLAPTGICGNSWAAATQGLGAGLAAVDAVLTGQTQNAFAAIRPPGHHAVASRAMGFCLFNNIAVAARYAQSVYGIERIFILDWDVHHGNGTQDIFYEDGSVFFCSIHQEGLYPGTGLAPERGQGAGLNKTLNIPIRAWSADDVYFTAFEQEIYLNFMAFRPELVLISAGFDCRENDNDFSATRLSGAGIEKLTNYVLEWADQTCNGRVVSLLEGGYGLDILPDSVLRHVKKLAHS